MDAKDKLIKARAALVLDSPFFGSLALRLKVQEGNWQPTMATNGIDLVYNSQWVDELSMDELKGVVCHEIMHVASAHQCRRGSRDPLKWNIAGDHAINHILKDAGLKLPKGNLCDDIFKDMSAEKIYSHLPQEPPGGDKGKGQGQGTGQNQPGQQPGQPGSDPGNCGTVMDFPGTDGPPTPAQLDQQAQDWQIATTQAAQAAKAAGKLPGSLKRLVEDLNEPKVNWKEVLQRFVNQAARNDYSWSRPNPRYFAQGIILPGLYNQQMPPLVVAIDTSGSISQDDLKQFAGEIDEIIGQYNTSVTVIYCDTDVAGIEEFTQDNRPVRLDAKGGGGTRFSPVFKHVEGMDEQPACLIYLTDLESSDFGPAPDYPVLWIKTEGRKTDVPFGEIVCM